MDYTDLLLSNTKWFYRLVPTKDELSLMSYHKHNTANKLMICGINAKGAHLYTLFDNCMKFSKFQAFLPSSKRCFFEIINGESLQKPHFDLDIGKQMKEEEVNSIIETFIQELVDVMFELYKVKLDLASNLLVFTSHSNKSSSAWKRSFHVIIDGYCHTSNVEARGLYEYLVRNNHNYNTYLDGGVYSKTQQFRMVFSQKYKSGRIKTLMESWSFQGQEISYSFRETPINATHRVNLIIGASTITNTGECKILPNLITAPPTREIQESEDLPAEMVQPAFQLLGDEKKAYQIREVTASFIILKRVSPSKCRLCQRFHEHENPYLIVASPDELGSRSVYFDCRRGEGRYYLGEVGSTLSLPPPKPAKVNIVAMMTEFGSIPMKTVRQRRIGN